MDCPVDQDYAAESVRFDVEYRRLLDAIRARYHYDFRDYAPASLRRRLKGALRSLDCASLAQLEERSMREPAVFAALLDHLTIQVSEMFRDPGFFRALRVKVVPLLRTWPSLKVWVAGCAAGEEAYSIAILLREEGLLDRTLIYATDINPRCLAEAQRGIYPIGQMAAYTRSYLEAGGCRSLSDYYTAAYGGALLDRSLREHILFCDHSLATDSVFAEVHLVSCRNVLIYFNRELQDRALGLFRESLCRRGFLGLGAKESLRFTSQASAFAPLARPERIFQLRSTA
jgi:chemotaxis protein methyltransferase CheR